MIDEIYMWIHLWSYLQVNRIIESVSYRNSFKNESFRQWKKKQIQKHDSKRANNHVYHSYLATLEDIEYSA